LVPESDPELASLNRKLNEKQEQAKELHSTKEQLFAAFRELRDKRTSLFVSFFEQVKSRI